MKYICLLAALAVAVCLLEPADHARAALSAAHEPAVSDKELSAPPVPAIEEAAPAEGAGVAEGAGGAGRSAPEVVETCVIRGMVFCTEYGTRFKEPLTLVTSGGHAATVSMDDGSFEITLPCPGTYPLRFEFAGKGFFAGTLTLPGDDGCTPEAVLDIHYSGSMLEIVREARAGNDDVSVSLVLK